MRSGRGGIVGSRGRVHKRQKADSLVEEKVLRHLPTLTYGALVSKQARLTSPLFTSLLPPLPTLQCDVGRGGWSGGSETRASARVGDKLASNMLLSQLRKHKIVVADDVK